MNKEVKNLLNDKDAFEKAAKQGFDEVDSNKNGKIDFEEIKAVLVKFSAGNGLPTPTKAEIEDVFKKLDIDKNGKIDFEEFKVFFKTFLTSS